ncbi:MAG: efflux RND transporter periplasmic adaptor subunit [Sumerlaeia bacterium]
MKINSLSIITIVALAGVGTASYVFRAPLMEQIQGQAMVNDEVLYTLSQQPFISKVYSIGELKAAKSSTLTSPFSGKIVKLAPEGTKVEVDDPVVWFETEELENELLTKQSQLQLDEKALQTAKDAYSLEERRNDLNLKSEIIKVDISRQSYEDAKQKFDSETILFEKNISPQTKLDEARLRMLQAELSLRNAQINLARVEENLEANLRVKQTDIEKARIALEKTERELREINEKIDGAVIRASNPGEIAYLKIWKSGTVAKVAEGDQIWRSRSLVEIPDTSQMLASVPVSEIDIGRLEIGQKALIQVEAIPGRLFTGTVEQKSSVPITDSAERSWSGGNSNGPREFEVMIKIKEQDPLLRQGMTASTDIIIYNDERAVPVPLEAIQEVNGAKGVVVMKNGQQEFQPIIVVRANESFAQLETPFPAGTVVLLNPPKPEEPTDVALEEDSPKAPAAKAETNETAANPT